MKSQHKIDEFVLDLSFESMTFARRQMAGLSSWVSTQVLPTIDEVFGAHFEQDGEANQTIFLDRLEIDLGSIAARDYQIEIPRRLAAKLYVLLKEHSTQLGSSQASNVLSTKLVPSAIATAAAPAGELSLETAKDPDILLEQFSAYLRSGRMPILSRGSDTALHQQMLEIILRQHGEQLSRDLREMYQAGHTPVIVQRLVQQFPQDQLVRILRELAPEHVVWLVDFLDAAEMLPLQGNAYSLSGQMEVFWERAFEAVLSKPHLALPQLMRTVITRSARQLRTSTKQLAESLIRFGVSAGLAPHLHQDLLQLATLTGVALRIKPKAPARLVQLVTPSALPTQGLYGLVQEEEVILQFNEADLLGYCRELRSGRQLIPSQLSVQVMQRVIRGLLTANTDLSSQQRVLRIAEILQGEYESAQPQQFDLELLSQLLSKQPKPDVPQVSPEQMRSDAKPVAAKDAVSIDAQDLIQRVRDALRSSTPDLMRVLAQFADRPALLHGLRLTPEEYQQLVRTQLMSDPGVHVHAREDLLTAIHTQSLLAVSLHHFYASVLQQLLTHSGVDLNLAASSQMNSLDRASPLERAAASSAGLVKPSGMRAGYDSAQIQSADGVDIATSMSAEPAKYRRFDVIAASAQELQRYCDHLRAGERSFVGNALRAETNVNALRRLAGAFLGSHAPLAAAHSKEFLDAIDAAAQLSIDIIGFYHRVVKHLIANETVDIEAILAQRDASMKPSSVSSVPKQATLASTEPKPHSQQATFSELSRQSNMQALLIEALLQGKPDPIQPHWHMLLAEHAAMLRSAIFQYGFRPEIRQQLSVGFPIDMLLDMTELLQPTAARVLRALFMHAELLRQIEPTHQSLDATDWKCRLWEVSFDEIITRTGNVAQRGAPFYAELHVTALISRRAGSERRTLLAMQKLWWEILKADGILSQPGLSEAKASEPSSVSPETASSIPSDQQVNTVLAAPQQLLGVLCQQLGLDHADLITQQTNAPGVLPTSDLMAWLDELLQTEPKALELVFNTLKFRLAAAVPTEETMQLTSPHMHATGVFTWPAAVWSQLNLAHIALNAELNGQSRRMLHSAIAEQAANAHDESCYQRAVFLQLLGHQGLDLDAALAQAKHAVHSPLKAVEASEKSVNTPNDEAAESSDSAAQPLTSLAQRSELLRLLNNSAVGTALTHVEHLQLKELVTQLVHARTNASMIDIHAGLSTQVSQFFADAHRVQRMLAQLPVSILAQLLACTHYKEHELLLRCMNIVADAASIIAQGVAPQEIARTKWQALFEYVYVQNKPLQAFALARHLGDVLARACGINDVSQSAHLRNLVQRRVALLMPGSEHGNVQKSSRKENIQSTLRKPLTLPKPTTVDFGEGTPLINAGMVLAAPYLPRLFAMVKLTVDGSFIDFHAKERAAHLLQFMVCGSTEIAEYQLLLNKLLCGIGTSIPVRTDVDLTAHEKSVAEDLLQGMIQNWNTIGKTSIGGIRETFLQRAGWIALQDDAWQLKVQSGPFDVLLDRLPWSFSIVKYGWMEKPVHVTWR